MTALGMKLLSFADVGDVFSYAPLTLFQRLVCAIVVPRIGMDDIIRKRQDNLRRAAARAERSKRAALRNKRTTARRRSGRKGTEIGDAVMGVVMVSVAQAETSSPYVREMTRLLKEKKYSQMYDLVWDHGHVQSMEVFERVLETWNKTALLLYFAAGGFMPEERAFYDFQKEKNRRRDREDPPRYGYWSYMRCETLGVLSYMGANHIRYH